MGSRRRRALWDWKRAGGSSRRGDEGEEQEEQAEEEEEEGQPATLTSPQGSGEEVKQTGRRL